MIALVVASACAAIDWYAVVTGRPSIERVAKPAVMAALIAALMLATDADARHLIIVAVALSLVGDVLLLPGIDRFVAGLGAFLGAHIAYIAAFLWRGVSAGALVFGALLGLAVILAIGRRIVAGAAMQDEALGRAVVAYVMVLSIMVTVAVGTRSPLLVAGALIFAASDGVLGWNRFVAPISNGRLATHVLYHGGQIAIVAAAGTWQ